MVLVMIEFRKFYLHIFAGVNSSLLSCKKLASLRQL